MPELPAEEASEDQVHVEVLSGQSPPRASNNESEAFPLAVIALVVAALVMTGAALFVFFSHYAVSAGEVTRCSLVTQIVPQDESGNALDDYQVELIDRQTGNSVAVVDVENDSGFTVGELAARSGHAADAGMRFTVVIVDNSTQQEYAPIQVELVPEADQAEERVVVSLEMPVDDLEGSNGAVQQDSDKAGAEEALTPEAKAAYNIVLDDWKRCIAEDKENFDFDGRVGGKYASSPRYVKEEMITGDGFLYAFIDLGLSEIPGMIVVDPDDGYKVYGVYHYDSSYGGEKIAKYVSHFRYWKYWCEGGVFRSYANHVVSERDDHPINENVSIERCVSAGPPAVLEVDMLDFKQSEKIECFSNDDAVDHYWFTDDSGVTFYPTGAIDRIAQMEAEHPLEQDVEWHSILQDELA